MEQTKHVYVFGDQTTNFSDGFISLLRSRKGPILSNFLVEALDKLRTASSIFPDGASQRFPRFSRFEELIEEYEKESIHPAFQQALTSIYHFACFISHCERNDGHYPDENSLLIGLCTGAFAAAAIGCCTTLSELVPVAIHTVKIAFNTGYQAAIAGEAVDGPPSSTSWSAIFHGLNEKSAAKLVQDFVQDTKLPPTTKPWISAVSDNNVTISGPPNVLDALQSTPASSKFRVFRVPIYAPYHGSNIFDNTTVDSILERVGNTPLSQRKSIIPTISSSSGGIIWYGTLHSIMKTALAGVLIEPLHWDSILRGFVSHVKATNPTSVTIFSIATGAGQSLSGALNEDQYLEGLSFNVESISPPMQNVNDFTQRSMAGVTKIAILGMSGRFPEAESCDEFWDILSQGLDVHKPAPDLHWNVQTHVDVTGTKKNTSATPYGCWLKSPGSFDARFFNMSPREAPQVDPAQRLALATAYEAMEVAGIVPDATPSTKRDRVGIFYGVTSNDWMETNSAQYIDTYFIPGGNRAFIPGRVNYFFKFSGPSYSIDTACSSSLAAIHLACNALWRREVDMALAGGTNVLTNPDFTAGLDRGHFLSRTGNCKTFDDTADGYCRGEGVVTLILKRLEDAIIDNDPIQAVILGARTNHSAEAESITRPHVGAQKEIFSHILSDAGVDPAEISYVEMHGTGTQAGDAGEMNSVLDTFASTKSKHRRRSDQPLYIGSAKANIGHGEAASGASSLVKVLLMMKHNVIPPHCGIKTKLNQKFPLDLEQRQVFIAKGPVSWPSSSGIRKVFVNNFSAAGGNSALLVEDAPEQPVRNPADPRTYFPVCVSAKTATALERNIQNLTRWVEGNEASYEILPALSYTTTARRTHHPHRVVISASDIPGICEGLRKAITNKDGANRPKAPPEVIFTFTGQGSQYAGMGKALIDANRSFREDLIRLDHLSQRQGFSSFWPVLTSSDDSIENQSPTTVQLAMVALEIALARLWISWGVTPAAVVGHSLGEYAALCIAGVISLADTMYLVGKRAQSLEIHCTKGTHSMLAVKSPIQSIQHVLRQGSLEVACINGPQDIVLAGRSQDILQVQQQLTDAKIKSTLLKVPFAFHSAQVEPILEDFERAAQGVKFHRPTIPILCPLLGTVEREAGAFSAKYLRDHCRKTVNILQAIEAARDAGVINHKSFVLEVGPHPVVCGMVKAVMGSQLTVLSSLQRSKDVWSSVTAALSCLYCAGTSVNWRVYQRDYRHPVLLLPAYGWDLKDYWIQYVNDWSLRKGDAIQQSGKALCATQAEDIPADTKAEPKLRLESTTIHKIISNSVSDVDGVLVLESDICRAGLHPMVQGHKVDGFPLCTPSVYADIALTVGKYLLQVQKPFSGTMKADVAAMNITKALIAKAKGPQILRTTVQLKWPEKLALCKFATIDDTGKVIGEHANCKLYFKETSKLDVVQVDASVIRAKMAALRAGTSTGKSFLFNKNMVYKMVTALADFDPNYRGIETIVLDSNAMEACSTANFAGLKNEGQFHTHPAFIDALSQVAGFVMNANDKSDLSQEVFVNHGWSSFQILEPILATKKYSTYVKMRETEGKMWRGDITVFDGEKVVAWFGDIALQGVPRRLLRYILAAEGGGASKAGTQANPAQSKPQSRAAANQRSPGKDAAKSQQPDQHKEQTKMPQPKTSSNMGSSTSAPKNSLEDNKRILQVLQVISEESGIAVDDLTESSAFADLGVDSLLSMLIISRLNDEMAIELDTSAFIDMPTIKHLKDFLCRDDRGQEEEPDPTVRDTVPSRRPDPIPVPNTGTTNNHELQVHLVSEKLQPQDQASKQEFEQVLQILAEESGITIDELTDDSNFADLGVDSLLSLMIVSRLQEELGIGQDWDSSFWADCATIGALRERLGGKQDENDSDAESEDKSKGSQETSNSSASTPPHERWVEVDGKLTPVESEHSDQPKPQLRPQLVEAPPASSVILQGRVKLARRVLFLFPDGSGSAHSYAKLPNINDDLAVVGLNCPFRKDAQLMESCPLDVLIDSYITEIRKRQPNGPYHLGGWSAGGILAYRATQQFIREGEEVLSLVLIDSPPPKGLDRLPQHFYDHCNAINLFGAKMANSSQVSEAPEWLIPHFNATITVLHNYWADPLPQWSTPQTSIIWASECVFDGVKFPRLPPSPDDTEGMKFLTEKRSDFSAGEWADLFPGDEITVEVAHGADHFSLLNERADVLAQFIDRATF